MYFAYNTPYFKFHMMPGLTALTCTTNTFLSKPTNPRPASEQMSGEQVHKFYIPKAASHGASGA